MYWRCSQCHNTRCQCVCKVEGENVFFDPTRVHNHPDLKDKDIDLMVLREGIKSYGIICPDDKPFHVISNCVETSAAEIDVRDFNNLRKVLYRRRRKILSRPPKTKSEALETLKKLVDADDELVQSVSNDIAIICRISDLQLLNEDGIEVFADGTFKYSPRHFKQMYTIFALKNGFYIPVLHLLLQDKKQRTYKKALIAVRDLCHEHGIDLQKKFHHLC